MVNATGKEETNTVCRAELVAICVALQMYEASPCLAVLSDSLISLQKVGRMLQRPADCARDHHKPLLEEIVALIHRREGAGLPTSLQKVPAHRGIWGNEKADEGAKQAVQQPEAAMRFSVAAEPHRPEFWPFFIPASRGAWPEEAGGDEQEGEQERYAVHPRRVRQYVGASATYGSLRPSVYGALWERARGEGTRVDLAAAGIHSRGALGLHRQAGWLYRFVWGQLYTGKLAKRYGRAATDACPLCGWPDSCGHVGGGCRALSPLYINRHNAAVRLVAEYVQNGAHGASLVSCDAGAQALGPSPSFDALLEAQEGWMAARSQEVALEVGELWPASAEECAAARVSHGNWSDVTLDARSLAATLEAKRAARQGLPPPVPHVLPDWLLPQQERERLVRAKQGVTPDLVFVKGMTEDPASLLEEG